MQMKLTVFPGNVLRSLFVEQQTDGLFIVHKVKIKFLRILAVLSFF